MKEQLTIEAIALLDSLIATPSVSRDEAATADIVEAFLKTHVKGNVQRIHNNVYVRTPHWDDARPTLLMNSHHDTVKPSAPYTRNPYEPTHEEGRIYGLGSNDAGASAVSLIAAYRYYEDVELPFNMLLAISAEEEVMGEHGMRALLPELGKIDMALVGEPTGMQAAVGERGLVVMDCVAHGVRGHAARNEGVNAIDIAIRDILERSRTLSPSFLTTIHSMSSVVLKSQFVSNLPKVTVVPTALSFKASKGLPVLGVGV